MGMAIEDGYWLTKSLDGLDLADLQQLALGLARYDRQRVAYTNKQAIIARRMGYLFHRVPWPISALRDAVFDRTPLLEHLIVKEYLKDAEDQMLALELTV